MAMMKSKCPHLGRQALSVDPVNAYIMELLNIALESASAQTLEAVAMHKVKEQIRVQSERLQEKYRRSVPQAKEIFEKPPSWFTRPEGPGTVENSLDVEDMSVG